MSKKRRATHEDRCPRCRINYRWCFCDHLRPVHSDVRVSIVMHYTERWLTSNTAYFASLILSDCEIIERGNKDTQIPEALFTNPQDQYLYLFPTQDSKPISKIESTRRLHLVVPDGSWSKAKKIHKREDVFKDMPKYHLDNVGQSRYMLRKSPGENFLCTYEAIAHALGILDGPKVKEDLMKPFDTFVERVLMSRTGKFLKD